MSGLFLVIGQPVRLCAPCCDNCPEVVRVQTPAGERVRITDDNDPGGEVRGVVLTDDQFRLLQKEGEALPWVTRVDIPEGERVRVKTNGDGSGVFLTLSQFNYLREVEI